MNFWLAVSLLAAGLFSSTRAWAEDRCPPEGASASSLQLLKQHAFDVEEAAARNALALGLLGCLASPDPQVRDGIAYEALTAWLRGDRLEVGIRRELRDRLYPMLGEADEAGFRQPFAAQVLSEVARTDRLAPWMSPEERAAMVAAAAQYLQSVRDYRGYDDAHGWRHGVAHGSDWLMQLALNPALERGQLDAILSAVATQAVPEAAHAYVFGEPGRLARPVLQIAGRDVLTEAEWIDWFSALPSMIGDPSRAYADSAWLARRHDLVAFLSAIYVDADQSQDEKLKVLKVPVLMTLKAIP